MDHSKINVQNFEPADLQSFKDEIRLGFINRTLHKGVAQVVKALYSRANISRIYVCGELDAPYKATLEQAIKKTNPSIQVTYLEKIHRRLVYDVIKDVDLGRVRTQSRRFFLCRCFAI